MKNRTIKNRFKRLDELSLPAKEKMLPAEALTDKNAYVAKERKAFPKLAVASLAIVALAVATGLVIGSVAGGNEKQLYPNNNLVLNNDIENTSTPSILENEASVTTPQLNSAESKESEIQKTNLPIVSCGKAQTVTQSSCECLVPYGEVAVGTMHGVQKAVDKLQDNVLYAVYFSADYVGYGDYFAETEYAKELRRLEKERNEKVKEAEERAIAFIEKYAKAENHPFLDSNYKSYDYHKICTLIYNQCWPEHWPGQAAPEFEEVSTAVRRIWDEYEDKEREHISRTRENTTAKMYEYLDSLGIKFYDKTVYVYSGLPETEEPIYEDVYRVAFLTKSEIAALKGGEDYGLLVTQVFEEMAKQDNEPVHLNAWVCLA